MKPTACIYKGFLYKADEFPQGIPKNSTPLYAGRPPLTEDEIMAHLGHTPLDYCQAFYDGVQFAEKTHL